ncbi:MAG TPA: PTS sugar transporter subunit IIA [Thermoanaerobaculia bacterium]|nr:PTS sugar transporter subunit IIA [Thermoanaerobaculia bacterium]
MVAGSKKEDSPDLKAMMTLSEVSNCLSLSAACVCRIAGELKAIRVAGRWRFRMSDVEQWLLKARPADELPIEPVEDLGSHVRLVPHLEEANVFLDVPESEAPALIRNAIHRARLDLTESPERAARERIYASVMEWEASCGSVFHPDVAFPHPREPEKCPLGSDRIVVVRSRQPVEFREVHGYRPRIVLLLLVRTVSLQLHWEARLSHLLYRRAFVERVLSARSARELWEIFDLPVPEATASAGR